MRNVIVPRHLMGIMFETITSTFRKIHADELLEESGPIAAKAGAEPEVHIAVQKVLR
jgi:hypothetical protein